MEKTSLRARDVRYKGKGSKETKMENTKPPQQGLGRAATAPSTDTPPLNVAAPQVPAPQLDAPVMRKDGAVARASGVTGSLKRYQG